jgi:putative PIN family toxin of toxin-antitoxin system
VRVVLDTNILVSGLMSVSSPPAQILNALRAGQIVAVMSDATLAELAQVFQRPAVRRYFTHSAITPDAFLAELQLHIDLIIPLPTATVIRDEQDRPFLDLLATIPPPQYFVTGDKDFEASHYSGVPVISAAEFARLLRRR